MSQIFNEIPANWAWTKLGDILSIISGEAFKKNDYSFSGIRLLQIANVSFGKVVWEQQNFLPEDFMTNYPELLLEKNDIVMALNRPILDGLLKIACIKEEDAPAILYQRVARFKLIKDEMRGYFFHYALSPMFVQLIRNNLQGTDQPYINTSTLPNLPIPISPLNEQRRIVTKIEALKARSQQLKEALEAIPPLLEQFRQSVLAAAFRGDLTADWREKNPDVEPASVLLEQIREKRKNRTEGKSKKSTDFGLPETKIEQLPKIPDSWHWICFGELITSIRSGSTAVPQDIVSDYPILRSSSVRPGSINFEDIRYLTKDQSLNEDNFLCEGDVLFTRLSSSLDYVANCAVVRDLKDHCIQYPDRIFRAKLIDAKYSNYSELCFASPLLRALITGNAKSSAGHQRISMGTITEAPIPLPPLLEQQEIVRRVHSLWKTTNQLETNYQEAEAYIDQLDQSILAKAFRGELVPQDPNDEPASVLLERIRAERAKQETAAKTAKKSTTKTSGKRRKKTQQQDSESVQLGLPGLE